MRTICFVSDRTGVTAETMGHSLLSQFEGLPFRSVTMPFVTSVEQARGVVGRINAIAREERVRPIVFCTLVDEQVRATVKEANGLFLDFFAAFLKPLETELGMESAHASGRALHGTGGDRPTLRASTRSISHWRMTTAPEHATTVTPRSS